MPTAVVSYPPLDQVTVARNQDVKLSVLLDVPASQNAGSWQVALWYSLGGEWNELHLRQVTGGHGEASILTSFKPASSSTDIAAFEGQVKVSERCLFTIKFRDGSDGSWQWVRDQWGVGDGTIIFNPAEAPEDRPGSLPLLIKNLDPAWHWSSVQSQTPKTSVWTLTAPVEGVSDSKPVYKDFPIGVPFGGYLRWFAIVRIRRPWVLPRQGRDRFELDRPAIIASFLGADGRHMVLLALSGTNDVMTLLGHGPNGAVTAQVRNDGTNTQSATAIVVTGHDFGSAVAAAMYQARSMVMSCKAMEENLAKEVTALGNTAPDSTATEQDGEVGARWLENWYDGLGYCTWNAFGREVTDEKIFGALDKLAEFNVRISSLIIDDNWQSIEYTKGGPYHQGWLEFEAEKESFPHGLEQTVERVRLEHPHIKYIAVWHALLGYWGGVSPRGKIASQYQTRTIEREYDEHYEDDAPIGGPIDVVTGKSAKELYDDFYRFLASCGVNSVKTDAQFMLDTVVDAAPRREMVREYLDAWAIASLRHLSNRAISCMSHTPQIMFYGLLPNNRSPVLFRNSDDFMPEIESSHPWHLWTNAHNAIFSSHLNVIIDWDMFQTVHDYSAYHAAARCVSGGPIYITDIPGEHNIDLIRQMTGTSIRGTTVIFRPSVAGKTTDPYIGYHDKKLLKVGSYHGRAGVGASFLGVFNVSTEPVTELVPFTSFPGLTASASYVVRSHDGRITKPIAETNASGPLLPERLGVRGWVILTATPSLSFGENGKKALPRGPVSVSNLGLVDKMTGAAAIIDTHAEIEASGARLLIEVRLKALGTLGVYISTLAELSIEDDFMATILNQPIPAHTVSKADGDVLKIDLEAAWKEMGLESRWGNELILKLHVGL